MNILGIIPARGGSKGVPGKNIRKLAGKPLIAHTIDSAKISNLTKLIVSTDSKQIADIAQRNGVSVPFLRPVDLASDTAGSIEVSIHALHSMEALEKTTYDAIMLLQPTTPFRSVEDINKAISIFENNPVADSVISVVAVDGYHPARMKYIENGRLIDPEFCEAYENQNRQELRPMYIRNGAIYLTKRSVLLRNSYKGENCMAIIMPQNRSVNIDTLHDFDYADWIYHKDFSL